MAKQMSVAYEKRYLKYWSGCYLLLVVHARSIGVEEFLRDFVWYPLLALLCCGAMSYFQPSTRSLDELLGRKTPPEVIDSAHKMNLIAFCFVNFLVIALAQASGSYRQLEWWSVGFAACIGMAGGNLLRGGQA